MAMERPTLDIEAVLESYGQCTCEEGGTRCFRVPVQPNVTYCIPCAGGYADNHNGSHGYGAGPLAAAVVTPNEPPALPLEQAIRRVVAWEYTLERSDMANVLELQAAENGLRVAPAPPVAPPLYPMAVRCADAACAHERGDHAQGGGKCDARLPASEAGRWLACVCLGFRLPIETTV